MKVWEGKNIAKGTLKRSLFLSISKSYEKKTKKNYIYIIKNKK